MQQEPDRWRRDFARNGYLIVEDVVDTETLSALKGGVDQITADPDTLPPRLKPHVHMERDYARQQPQYNDLDGDQVGNAVKNIMELPLFDPVRQIVEFETRLRVDFLDLEGNGQRMLLKIGT